MNTAAALLLAAYLGGAAQAPAVEPPNVETVDLERFPPAWAVEANLEFIAAHREWLEGQHGLCLEDARYWEWRRRDMYWRWDVWDDLRLAQQADGECRLAVLRNLRRKIGWDAYGWGIMPNCCYIEGFWIIGK